MVGVGYYFDFSYSTSITLCPLILLLRVTLVFSSVFVRGNAVVVYSIKYNFVNVVCSFFYYSFVCTKSWSRYRNERIYIIILFLYRFVFSALNVRYYVCNLSMFIAIKYLMGLIVLCVGLQLFTQI